jgi:hypothetical protein
MKDFLSKISKATYQKILSTIVVVAVLGFDYMFFLKEIPAGNKDIATAAFGILNTGGFALIVNYWLGASFKEKNEQP